MASDMESGIEDIPPYEITEFFYGYDIPSELTVICRGRRLFVCIKVEELQEESGTRSPSLAEEFQTLLDAVMKDDDMHMYIDEGLEKSMENADANMSGHIDTNVDEGISDADRNGDGQHHEIEGNGNQEVKEDQQAKDVDGEDYEHEDPMEAMYEWLMVPLLPILRSWAPSSPTSTETRTLDDFFRLPTSSYLMKAVQGVLTAIPTSDESVHLPSLAPMAEISLPESNVPFVHPAHIRVPWDEESKGSSYPRKVMLENGLTCFFKPCHHGRNVPAQRELENLIRIHEVGLTSKVRVPKVEAIVKYDHENRLTGYLITFIENKDTLEGEYARSAPISMRRRWYREIKDMITELHQLQIVWGDAKADNILIDFQDQPWLIDFGGSFTPGWVDRENLETIAGDLQALSKIKEHLGVR